MKSQKTLISLIIFVAAIIGYAVYKNVAKPQIVPIDVATTVDVVKNEINTEKKEETDAKLVEKTTQLLATLPDLARPVIVLAKIAPETETMARTKIAELEAGLSLLHIAN